MFNFNPFHKKTVVKSTPEPKISELKQVNPIDSPGDSNNIIGMMYISHIKNHDSDSSKLSSYELLMSPITPDIKTELFDNEVRVIGKETIINDLKLNNYLYHGNLRTYKLQSHDEFEDIDDEIQLLTEVGYQLVNKNECFFRVNNNTKGKPVLMYELFENQDNKTMKSNYIRQVVKNKLMNYDLFNPYAEPSLTEYDSLSVYSLLEVLIFMGVELTQNSNRSSVYLSGTTINEEYYRTHLEHLLHINYICNTLELPEELLNNLITAQGYSIFHSLLDLTNLDETKQEYNKLYSLVKEVNIGIDKITTKLYTSLINKEPLSSNALTQITTALKHESHKVCETMSDLDSVTNSSIPSTKAKELTTSQTDEEWKSFLQFLND